MSEKEVNLRSKESLFPTHAFRANLAKIFSNLRTRRAQHSDPQSRAAIKDGSAAGR
jgi:hypothetical protein